MAQAVPGPVDQPDVDLLGLRVLRLDPLGVHVAWIERSIEERGSGALGRMSHDIGARGVNQSEQAVLAQQQGPRADPWVGVRRPVVLRSGALAHGFWTTRNSDLMPASSAGTTMGVFDAQRSMGPNGRRNESSSSAVNMMS